VNTACKAVFAVASFHDSSAQFANPAWCSNSSKFVRSRVNLQVCLIVRFVNFLKFGVDWAKSFLRCRSAHLKLLYLFKRLICVWQGSQWWL